MWKPARLVWLPGCRVAALCLPPEPRFHRTISHGESMQTQFDLKSLEAERLSLARPYFEFLRVPAMSAGIYLLPAGGTDKQKPHGQDEIYYVIRGRAGLTIQDGKGAP